MLASGCAGAVDGGAVRAPGVDLTQALPTAEQVGAAVGNPLNPGPIRLGGIDLLPNGIRDAGDVTPLDCLGVATPLMRVVYQLSGVNGVALQDFSGFGHGLTVSSAHTGVVRFDSDTAAATLFDTFAARWRACQGTVVRVHVTPTSALEWTVADVRQDDGILSATILNGGSGEQPAFPTEHAVGLADDCIVDVDVAVTDTLPERRVATGRAVRLVAAIRDRITGAR